MHILLSKSTWPVLRYVTQLLGWLMNGIYELLDKIGAPNVGLAMVFFTIIIYLILTPVQYKTQKSSKVMAALNPELQKIQKKYQGKRDQYSMQKMQEETQALYRKYGVSMTGTCLPMLIQLPLLLCVYQVILHIPGYIAKIRGIFDGLAAQILSIDGARDLLANFVSDNRMRTRIGETLTQENVIDFLYALKPSQWTELQSMSKFSSLQSEIAATAAQSRRINSFLGINISESPWDAIKNGFSSITHGGATGAIVLALLIGILIPVLAWFTQWLNYKLMPQQAASGENNAANQMQTMNTVMPVFSAFICLTLSMGIGIYWIVGAVIRCVQQVIINRKIGKIDMGELETQAKERAKAIGKEEPAAASVASRRKQAPSRSFTDPHGGRARQIQDTEQYYSEVSDVAPDSITAKANMVRNLDARSGRKNAQKKK